MIFFRNYSLLAFTMLVSIVSGLKVPPTEQQALSFQAQELDQTNPASLLSGFEALATAVMGCGDIGDSCAIFGCWNWALCSPYNVSDHNPWGTIYLTSVPQYKCQAKVPWSRNQLAPVQIRRLSSTTRSKPES
ncbi:hypothetical protein J3R30DRAFT_3427499 [Lentinula aciculospora]|uniref:Uncharacterized protein n=1 Tax=Lentinula aciculospora TaxID=153920 RepID=A0A9W9AUJ8_9AGAR|nr:hypothetical protein J3R30DRAFT_3427499 [Lentinula aciculospora]